MSARISSLILALTLTPMSADARPDDTVAVLVGFRGAIDRGAVTRAGGRIHSEWPELGGVGARLPVAAVAALGRNPAVAFVEEDRPVYALSLFTASGEETWGNFAVKAPQTRALGVTGAGITVCVIDSGYDALHPEFTRTPAVFGTGKDFIDGDSDPTDYGCDTTGCYWGTGHGTHVSGTVAAQFGVGGLGGSSDPDGIGGVAPGVTVVMYRVLGLDGSGSTTNIINAINACKALPGKKVASLSLGSTKKSTLEQRAFDAAYTAGVLTFAAAGNAGTTALSYPAGYTNVISVAAVDANLAHASFSQYNSDVELAAPGVLVESSVPRGQGRAADVVVGGVTYASSPVDYSPTGAVTGALADCGLCDSTSSCLTRPTGFVALCDRGVNTFAEKVTNAMAQGAAAVIIANNDLTLPDDPGLFTLGAAGAWVPTASVSYNSGVAMGAQLGSAASVSLIGSDYALWDGTSMATPHASACAALVWSRKTTLTNVALRTLLNSKAVDLGTAGRDVYFGYGLVDCYAAATAP